MLLKSATAPSPVLSVAYQYNHYKFGLTPQYITRSYSILTSWIVIALGKWRNKELFIMMMEAVTFLYLSCHAMIYADVSTYYICAFCI